MYIIDQVCVQSLTVLNTKVK